MQESSSKKFTWRIWQINPNIAQEILSNQKRLEQITHDGFGSKKVAFTRKSIQKAISITTHIALLSSSEFNIEGFAFYFVTQEPLLVGTCAYINNICISKNAQHGGFGKKLVSKITVNSKVAWLGARTQNPHIIKLLGNNSSITYPIDTTYDNGHGTDILKYAHTHIPQLAASSTNTLQHNTGIYENYYGHRLGDFPITSSVQDIEKRLNGFGFQRKNGDAVLVMALQR